MLNVFVCICITGNSLGGGYGEPDGAYERRRRARSNDYLDRIDVCSSVLLSTRSATTIGKDLYQV